MSYFSGNIPISLEISSVSLSKIGWLLFAPKQGFNNLTLDTKVFRNCLLCLCTQMNGSSIVSNVKHEPGSFVCWGSNSICLWNLIVFREVCKTSFPGWAIILTSEDSEALIASISPGKKLLLLMLLASKIVQRKLCLRKSVSGKYTENMVK